MPTPLYGDIEKTVVGWLIPRFATARVCTELPATLPAQVIHVARFGGGRPSIPFDVPNVDIDCYATDRASAQLLAEQVSHALLFDLPGYADDGTTVVSVECMSAPSWAPYDNTTIRRFTAAYTFRTRNSI